MLILARYPQEALLIGEVRVTVLHVARRKHGRARVTLGIDAPPEIPILRAELPRHQQEINSALTTHLEVKPEDHGHAMPAHDREEADA